jgi:hypothetical protein
MLPVDVIKIISKYTPVWRLHHKPKCDVMLKVGFEIYSFRLLPEEKLVYHKNKKKGNTQKNM